VESLGWVFGCSLGGELQFGRGEVGWERRRRRNRGRECRQMGAYNVFFRRTHRRKYSVGDSATSLYGYLSLNPPVISVGKSLYVTTPLHISRRAVKFVGIYRQILRRNYFRRYILPTEKFRR